MSVIGVPWPMAAMSKEKSESARARTLFAVSDVLYVSIHGVVVREPSSSATRSPKKAMPRLC